MASLTRQEVIDAAMILVNEQTSAHLTTTVQNTLANMANRRVFELIVKSCSHYVVTSTSFTWPANTERVDITGATYLNAHPVRIITIEDYPSTGGIGSGNLPRQWVAVESSILPNYHYQGTGPHYVLDGDYLYVAPLFGQALNCRVKWIPEVTPLTATSTPVLSGTADSFGDAVTACLAKLFNARQSGVNKAVEAMWAEWQSTIAGSAHRQSGPKMVTYRRRY